MNDMEQKDLCEIHSKLLILLNKFHQICTENHIKYSLHGGTLLGAIREKGFIPWDDDADVSMMRSEYNKLKSILTEQNTDCGILFDDRLSYIPRVVMKDEKLGSVWVDIFIYDYISEIQIFQKLKLAVLTFLIMFTKSREMMKVVKAAGHCRGWKYRCYDLVSRLGSLFPLALRIGWMDSFCKNCFVGKKKLIHRGLDQYSVIGQILPKDVMREFQFTTFEDTELMVSTRYQEILIPLYGDDYMVPKRFNASDAVHNVVRNLYTIE